jgi:hypothetical protein
MDEIRGALKQSVNEKLVKPAKFLREVIDLCTYFTAVVLSNIASGSKISLTQSVSTQLTSYTTFTPTVLYSYKTLFLPHCKKFKLVTFFVLAAYTAAVLWSRSRWSGNFLLESEPVERQLFVGAGAQIFLPGSCSGCVNLYKMIQKALNCSFYNLKLSANIFFVATVFTLKNLLVLTENFGFFSEILTGAGPESFDKLVPEPPKNGPAPQHC